MKVWTMIKECYWNNCLFQNWLHNFLFWLLRCIYQHLYSDIILAKCSQKVPLRLPRSLPMRGGQATMALSKLKDPSKSPSMYFHLSIASATWNLSWARNSILRMVRMGLFFLIITVRIYLLIISGESVWMNNIKSSCLYHICIYFSGTVKSPYLSWYLVNVLRLILLN